MNQNMNQNINQNNLKKINFNSFQTNKLVQGNQIQQNQIQQNQIQQNEMQQNKLSQMELNKLISGLQVASQNGMTQLPNKHIPQNTINITNDPNIQPNYIPKPQIENDIVKEHYKINENVNYSENKTELFFEKIKIPFIAVVVFFTVQSSIFNKILLKYSPINDSNNIFNKVFKGLFFGVLFTVLLYLINYINEN